MLFLIQKKLKKKLFCEFILAEEKKNKLKRTFYAL